MTTLALSFATPSVFESTRDTTQVGLSANDHRPVRFRGKIKSSPFLVRIALQALGQAVWSQDSWMSGGDWESLVLDPVVTVHPDRLMFEAFSGDRSVYALVTIDRSVFETEGEVRTGTTNVDFTAWLWAALAELRSRRETWFSIEPEGFEVRTKAAGGRWERKVDLPDSWVRGFLQVSGAMAMPGTRLTVRPIDLLSALRFLRYSKARTSPRALRYELEPECDARIVLEPWEHVVGLKGATHSAGTARSIRTWGRRRLHLIEPLLPFADSVEVYLKGRALPSFYAVGLGPITYVLGLTGHSGHGWTGTASFDLLSRDVAAGSDEKARALELLTARVTATPAEVAEALSLEKDAAARALEALCREGRAVYDVQRRSFRHRELFAQPVDLAALYPPDPRRERGREHVAAGRVTVRDASPRETRKVKKLPTPDGPVEREIVYRDWCVTGEVADARSVEIVVHDEGRIIFGSCTCPFFKEHLLNEGPCEHMLALFEASEPRRVDLPTSREARGPDPGARPSGARRSGEDAEGDDADAEDES